MLFVPLEKVQVLCSRFLKRIIFTWDANPVKMQIHTQQVWVGPEMLGV